MIFLNGETLANGEDENFSRLCKFKPKRPLDFQNVF